MWRTFARALAARTHTYVRTPPRQYSSPPHTHRRNSLLSAAGGNVVFAPVYWSPNESACEWPHAYIHVPKAHAHTHTHEYAYEMYAHMCGGDSCVCVCMAAACALARRDFLVSECETMCATRSPRRLFICVCACVCHQHYLAATSTLRIVCHTTRMRYMRKGRCTTDVCAHHVYTATFAFIHIHKR